MEKTLLQQLKAATSQEDKAAIMLGRRLASLPEPLQTAVKTAAIPHWFNFQSLTHLLPTLDDSMYYALIEIDFVEQVIGRGYAIQEKARQQILATFWREDEEQFCLLSGKAADFSASQERDVDAHLWQAEEIYHRLISDQEAGIESLKGLATKWANYQYSVYEEIAYAIELASEQVDSGRLTGEEAHWTRLWQAKLALIYGHSDRAKFPLEQIDPKALQSDFLVAEYHQTRGDWLAIRGDREEMEAAWRRAYDLYRQSEDGRLDSYLISEKLRQEGLPLPEEETVTETRPPTLPGEDGLRLIDNIKSAWIEGVLEKALDEKLELRMGRARSQPANIVYHHPQSLDRPLAGEHHLSRLFDAAGRSLLILGAPGSGKTITLLQLLEELLEEARQDGRVPIPLLFNLSSYTAFVREKKGKEHDLGDWLAVQAYNQYRLNRKTTRRELEKGRFTLLLDGLDEVSAEDDLRERCVTAINEFIKKNPCGLVVCSRITDYQTLENRLELAQALVLQPLSNRQIEAFIRQIQNPDQQAMLETIHNNWQLREALRSPLLLNLFPQTFPAVKGVADERSSLGETVEDQRQGLFAAYVDTVFEQPFPIDDKTKYESQPREKRIQWLSFLANRMQQHATSLFYIEDLQPTWLPSKTASHYQTLFGLFLGLINGCFVGLISTLTIGLANGLSDALLSGLFFSLLGPVAGLIAVNLSTRAKQPWTRAGISFFITIFISTLIGGVVGILSVNLTNRLGYGLTGGVIGGIAFGVYGSLGFGLSNSFTNWSNIIELRELLKPTRPNRNKIIHSIKRGCFLGVIAGLVIWLGVWIIVLFDIGSNVGMNVDLNSWLPVYPRIGLGYLLSASLLGGFISLIIAFLDTPPVDVRSLPGQGVVASRRNALSITLLALLMVGLATVLINRKFWDDLLVLIFSLSNTFPPLFTWFGGLAWCQHWALRFVLWRNGDLPFRLVPWLDEMTERGLLRRVGGGYIFIHRSLLEYFAGLEEVTE